MNEKIINLPKFGMGAEVRSASFDEAENTIEVIWTTGAPVRRWSWRHDRYYQEILEVTPKSVRLDRLNAGAPFLNTHSDWDLSDVIGSVVPGSARIEGGKGYATVKLSRADEDKAIVDKIRDGIIRNISVGYAIHKVVKTDADGDGNDEEWRVVDWEPLEISAVPVPADAGSQIRKDAPTTVPCEFVSETRTEPDALAGEDQEVALSESTDTVEAVADQTDISATDNEEARVADNRVETRAAPRQEQTVDVAAEVRRAQDAERKRASEIRKLAKEAGEIELGDEHIDEGRSVAEFRSALLEKLMKREARATDNRSPARVGEEHHEKRAAAMQSALMHRADPSRELTDGAREYRGFSLMDMAREALEIRGVSTRGMARDEIAGAALAQRSGYGSTSDFPMILGNVVNTTLRAGYEAAGQTFRPIVREASVADFKAVNRAQLGEGPAFDKVNESGEYKRAGLAEGKESYKIATFGKIIAITRQVIINDDMNAFGRIPQLMGGAAAQLESDLVWAQILGNPTMGDGTALFHADHKNLPTAAAFAVGPLGIAKALMAKQVGLDGKTVLNIRPQFLIVPVDLETKAEQELKLLVNVADTSKAATASMRSLTIISEPRLDNGIKKGAATASDISGSATAWYLAASPSQIDTVELAYLEGNRGVYIETRQGFDVDGLEVKARLDVGAKTMDHRGLLKNAGA